MFRIFRVVKWSKHVVKCGQNQEKATRKIPIASASKPRLFLCLIVTLDRNLFKSFLDLIRLFFRFMLAKNYAALNKEKRREISCPHLIFLPLTAFSLDGAISQQSHTWQKFILP